MTIRVAAIQAKNRTIPYKIGGPAAALDQARANLDALVELAEKAAVQGCQIAAFPEDALGTLEWEAGHWDEVEKLLVPAEEEALSRLGQVAAARGIALICCNDFAADGLIFNTSILIGADGREIGRYRKVQPTLSERARAQGNHFPVFDLPRVGPVGLCICYDIVFPETTRALALGGADIVFHSTLGGASLADSSEVSLAAFRTRAAENFVYLVVAFRSGGSMIISPQGEILARSGSEPDAIVAADIDPAGDREAGDALGGLTTDYRARLFRERNPAAYAILTDPNPPALDRLQDVPVPSVEEAAALFAEGITIGTDAFYAAEKQLKEGQIEAARKAFTELSTRFGTLWMGRVARERLEEIESR